MPAKPTKLPEWGSAGATEEEPSEAKKDAGSATGEKLPAQFFNWLHRLLYEWAAYLNAPLGTSPNGAGISPTGVGSGAGVDGTGGSTGPGVKGTGSGGPGGEFGSSSGYGATLTGNATRAATRWVPQSFTPGSGPSTGDAGAAFFNSQDNNPYFYRAGTWTVPGIFMPLTTKTADYTAAENDHTILVNANSAAVTITLPPAADVSGQTLVIKKIDVSGNAVTIEPDGSEQIEGGSNFTLTASGDSVLIQSNGTAWYVLAYYT